MKLSPDVLAGNLRGLREERSLSLAQLSEMVGVSKSMLRQIETGQSSPTVATLWKIANGLRVPFTSLLQKQEPEVFTGSFTDNDTITGYEPGHRVYPVVIFSPQRPFEMYYVELDEGVGFDAEPHVGNTSEYVFVLEGTMGVTVDGKHHSIGTNEYISFPANCYHSYKNEGKGTCLAMMLISYLP